MNCEVILKALDAVSPASLAVDWDNVGLLVGRSDKEVKTVCVALDPSDDVIDEAADLNADLLITHHPLIFSPLRSVTYGSAVGRKIAKLIGNDISCFAMHTNYDVCRMGRIAAAKLRLTGCEPLDKVTVSDKNIPGGLYPACSGNSCPASDIFGNPGVAADDTGEIVPDPDKSDTRVPGYMSDYGIGAVGNLEKEMTLRDLCRLTADVFEIPGIRLYGDTGRKVSRVAVCPGSGRHMIDLSVKKDAEVLITGDIGHHEGLDATAAGLAVIDAGHYGTEHVFACDISDLITGMFPSLTVIKAGEKPPFETFIR